MARTAPQEVSLTTKNTASLTMGIAAIVVGILALLFGWVPFLGLLAIPVAVLGIVLAGIGLLLAMMRRFKGVGMPLLGGVLSVAGVGVPILSTVGTSVAIDEASNRVAEVRQRVDQDRAQAQQAREQEEAQREQEEARQEQEAAQRKASYIAEHVELYDVQASYMDALLDGRVPGVLFKLRNTGDATLETVEVTFYFRDESGATIAEEDFHPVLASSYSLASRQPLKPGYVWQMEKGKFYTAKSVPSEWAEGNVEAKVTDIEFAETPKDTAQ
jgi:hypothetical protein